MEIKWNKELFGVEIKDSENHFVISAQPSMVMDWYDSVMFYKDNEAWQLPTREHLKLIAEHIHEVNALIKANGGYEIRGWHWTADEYDEFRAWYVYMVDGYTSGYDKGNYRYVRVVSAL